jgi:hypothetical protein
MREILMLYDLLEEFRVVLGKFGKRWHSLDLFHGSSRIHVGLQISDHITNIVGTCPWGKVERPGLCFTNCILHGLFIHSTNIHSYLLKKIRMNI